MKKLVLCILVLCASSPGAALGSTYYVSKSGNDGNSCAQAQSPSGSKQTIASGLKCLTAGDTLTVRAGTYDEGINNNVPSGTSWSSVVRIAAYPGETVWLTPSSGEWAVYFGNDAGTSIINTQYVEFDGINISGANVNGATVTFDDRGGGVQHHIRFKNAEVHGREGVGAGSAAIMAAGHDNEFLNLTVHGTGGPYAFYVHGQSNLIDSCDIYDVSTGGVQIYHSTSQSFYAPPTGNIVRNTKIHDITHSSFFGAPDTRLWGILISGNSNQIYNNLIYNNTFTYQGGNAGVFIYTGSGNKVYNNTIANNTTDGIYVDSAASNTEVIDNIVYGNTGASFTDGGSGSLQTRNLFGVDPLFVNPSAGNYQLQAGSQAIDAGTPSSIAQTDFAGTARPQGAAVDIGAFEYSSVTRPTAPQSVRILP